ncbi:MAG: hypothetical protein AAGE96_00895 [Cyanobacteria bacterium P01_G01_bin.19]
MNGKNQPSLSLPKALVTLAIGMSTLCLFNKPAEALPRLKGFSIAQVGVRGVRSRINSPTPLNLRPRTHIPLPRSNYSHRYNRHHRGYYKQGHYNRHHRRKNRDRGTVIIINPSNHRSYTDYTNRNYIRVIRK